MNFATLLIDKLNDWTTAKNTETAQICGYLIALLAFGS